MPPIKLSKVTFPPPKPKPEPVPLPGDPSIGGGLPLPPLPPAPEPPVFDPPVIDPPVVIDIPDLDVSAASFGALQRAAIQKAALTQTDIAAEIPTELVDKVWNAIDVVPGLTLSSVLTMALQQFLRTMPQDFEREDG